MGLSSNILWHQTNEDSFYKILKSKKLLYSYSLEKIIPSFYFKPVAFPMISMSDYPVSEIGSNSWAYGDYCIGFRQIWGVKAGFSPVWYCTIRELSELVVKVVGFEGSVEFDASKPDGTMRKLIDVSKLHSLGWTHKVEIEDDVQKQFEWYQGSLRG